MFTMFHRIVYVFFMALQMSQSAIFVNASPNGKITFNYNEVDEYEMPGPCEIKGKSFCFEKGENYPDEKIAELLKDMHAVQVKYPDLRSSIGSRNGNSNDEPDCPYEYSNAPIYYIIDENDKVRVVVQSPDRFQQPFDVKWCKNEGPITRNTRHLNESQVNTTTVANYNKECVNTKINFYFYVLSEEDSTTMEIARAKGGIPVCCRCKYSPK